MFPFLSCLCGFTNYFEISNFVFSNIIPRGASTCKILTFLDYYFQKIVKFSFVDFLADLFLNFALQTYGTLEIFLLSAQNNLYIILSSYVECAKKIQVWMSCLQLVSRPPKSGCFFGNFTAELVLKSFSGGYNSL